MANGKTINRQSFRDGKIVIYQLEDRPKQLWICRIKLPNEPGYVYRGTGTSDLYEARKFADDLLDEMRINAKLGRSNNAISVKQLIAEYEIGNSRSGVTTKRVKAILAFLKTYAIPYFSERKAVALTSAEVTNFFDWRIENGARKAPSANTLAHEASMFRSFVSWCSKRGHINETIKIEGHTSSAERRPNFDSADWAILTRFLHQWVKLAEGKSGSGVRDRVMLINYVLILSNTGIRVGEARGLRWRDVESDVSADGQINVILHVKGKTGSREVVARNADVKKYFERIWELRSGERGSAPTRDEHIFSHSDGAPIHSFKKGFNTLIEAAGVERDKNGDRRTIYSLRHTYATFRLQEGVNHYVLARNMGTSVKMLEQYYGHTSNRAMADELTKNKSRKRDRLPWENTR
jgi:integrase